MAAIIPHPGEYRFSGAWACDLAAHSRTAEAVLAGGAIDGTRWERAA